MANRSALKTQDNVFSLPLPKGKAEAVYFDEGRDKDRAHGLALRIREGGSRKWVYFYRWLGRQQKITIGEATTWTLAQARQEAKRLALLAERDRKNPADERKAEKVAAANQPKTFGEAVAEYLAVRSPTSAATRLRMSVKWHGEATRYLNESCKPLHDLPVTGISRSTVSALLDKIVTASGPVAADRARGAMSAFFAWYLPKDDAATNPVIGTHKASDETPRERVLADAELAKVWLAAPESDYGNIVRLLILTGCRRDEIGALRWSEVDLKAATISLPGSRTKNGNAHVVPLSDMALTILRAIPVREGRDLVFGNGVGGYSGYSRSKEALDAKCGVTDWTIHDLRRTVRTGLGKLVQPHIAEAAVNHLPTKLIRTYDLNAYEAEKRDALDRWSAHVRLIVAQAEGANVTALRRSS